MHSVISRSMIRRSGLAAIAIGLFLLVVTGGICLGAPPTTDPNAGQWLSYGRDDTQQRYSPSTAINTQTVARLGLQSALDLPNESALVSTPLMVGDTLYFTGKFSVVYAVSARTAQIKWTFDPKSREELAKGVRRMTYNWGTSRGVASWKDSIIVAAVDGRLISLSAEERAPAVDDTDVGSHRVLYLYLRCAYRLWRQGADRQQRGRLWSHPWFRDRILRRNRQAVVALFTRYRAIPRRDSRTRPWPWLPRRGVPTGGRRPGAATSGTR